MSLRVGIDIGGTFTDAAAIDRSGHILTAKVLSTADPSDGFFAALDAITQANSDGIDLMAHGTTIATNSLIEQTFGPLALVTNIGFRDLLEIAFQSRPSLYDSRVHRAAPLIPRQRCFEIAGRIGPDGSEEEPLDTGAIELLGKTLLDHRPSLQAVVVCLLHSYKEPRHEHEVVEILQSCLGQQTTVYASSDISREFREFTRASTAVINAAVAQLVASYLTRVESGLAKRRIRAPLHVMQSNGGLVESSAARRRPAYMVESGPAAATMAAAAAANSRSIDRALALDIGGTTAKVALILDGKPAIAPELEVGPLAVGRTRLGRSGGYPLRTPCIDLVEIGAGGGSIAWLDSGGALRVGPRSAGAIPGPACYPNGGSDPTLTDANVLLGRILPDQFLGGNIVLHEQAAIEAFQPLAAAMQMDPTQAAARVIAVAVDAMAAALRLATVDKGFDPRDFTLFPLGGAGPLHACEIAENAGITRVVVMPHPGVGSAWGLLSSDLRVQTVESIALNLRQVDVAATDRRIKSVSDDLHNQLREQGVSDEARITVEEFVDLRYLGQSFELPITWSSTSDKEMLASEFHKEHHRRYGFSAPGDEIEIMALRVVAWGAIDKQRPARLKTKSAPPRPAGIRPIRVGDGGRSTSAPYYQRIELLARHELEGPCLVVDSDATNYLPEGWIATVDEEAYLIMRPKPR